VNKISFVLSTPLSFSKLQWTACISHIQTGQRYPESVFQSTKSSAKMGNGAKAQTKRERNNAKDHSKAPSSQLKSNAAAKTIICKTCRQDFQKTTNRAALEEHASNKHKKTYEDCFA
jgi:hypothetical protein